MYARVRASFGVLHNFASAEALTGEHHCSLSEKRTRMSRSNLSRKALVSADADCGLSHTGLPLKRKFRPRCCAKTRAGAPCIMRVVPGKRRCRFPRTKAGRARIAEAQRRRWFSVTQILGFATILHHRAIRVGR